MNGPKWLVPVAAVAFLGACTQGGGTKPVHISADNAHAFLAKICSQPPPFQCVDRAFTVTLKKRDGSTYSHTFEPPMPVIHKRSITIFSGQTLNVEAVPGPDGRLGRFKLVRKVIHPAATLVLHLEQSSRGMLLMVHNPFDRPLRYEAGIRRLEDAGFTPTDVCPVMAKLGGIEMWPEPLFQVRLAGLRLETAKHPDLSCR